MSSAGIEGMTFANRAWYHQ